MLFGHILFLPTFDVDGFFHYKFLCLTFICPFCFLNMISA